MLVLDPNDVLAPTRYSGSPGDFLDIALIGLSKKNKDLIINFFT